MVEEVLPEVPYVPLVFTIPKILRPAFLFDRKLYGDLCRTAYAVVRAFLEERCGGPPNLELPWTHLTGQFCFRYDGSL
jgi:hypothetical protein